MEILNPRSALLSNFEVLELLRQFESEHLTRTKTAIRIKKEEEAAGVPSLENPATTQTSENFRTIQIEAIQYLSADYLPTSSQTADGITHLVKDLAQYDLTKGEKLQIVNLAPTQPVELYAIVEEIEDRFPDETEVICNRVVESLSAPTLTGSPMIVPHSSAANSSLNLGSSLRYPEDEDADVVDEMMFDDTGEGAGIEGDLDREDD
ncbi:hypothetical protein D9757_002150 [Collybiopsis confluens]|uniref:DNA-directed RNA polymerase III subunit RPC9 n=1 Tax=Collybiopsis confluens TaxID=2823264 RepID=A0A8H5MG20_9AGAR|nr:hypothetical protein D9757_002150 [Collybiopsis confluens]